MDQQRLRSTRDFDVKKKPGDSRYSAAETFASDLQLCGSWAIFNGFIMGCSAQISWFQPWCLITSDAGPRRMGKDGEKHANHSWLVVWNGIIIPTY
jgi:hypothetical protein